MKGPMSGRTPTAIYGSWGVVLTCVVGFAVFVISLEYATIGAGGRVSHRASKRACEVGCEFCSLICCHESATREERTRFVVHCRDCVALHCTGASTAPPPAGERKPYDRAGQARIAAPTTCPQGSRLSCIGSCPRTDGGGCAQECRERCPAPSAGRSIADRPANADRCCELRLAGAHMTVTPRRSKKRSSCDTSSV